MKSCDCYSFEKNRALLESLRENGLLSSEALRQKNIQACLSADNKYQKYVYVNAYSPHFLEANLSATLQDLFHNKQTGVFQIAYERKQEYFPKNYSIKKIICERLRHSILFVLDSESILENQGHLQQSLLKGETLLTQGVSPKSLIKAFVPNNLTSLFNSIFPDVDYTEVASVKTKFDVYGAEIYFGSDQSNKCKIPDFETSTREYVKAHLDEKKIQFFHLFRLTCPSDEELEKIQTEASLLSPLDIGDFNIENVDEVKRAAQSYLRLRTENKILENSEVAKSLKKFESRIFEIVFFTDLFPNLLESFKAEIPRFANTYFLLMQLKNDPEKTLNTLFDFLSRSKATMVLDLKFNAPVDDLYIKIQPFFNVDGKLQEEADFSSLNIILEGAQKNIARKLQYMLFSSFIKIPENLERFHQEIAASAL